MLGVPRSKVVRGFSFFGASFVYVIFEDGTDIYWARSRVLEYLNFAAGRLPRGVSPQLGPDATGVGWVYQYVLLGKAYSLAELRTLQDWFVRYQLTKARGVSEVASLGGFVQQYQVTVDPHRLQAYGISLATLAEALRNGNRDVGGRVIELAETEYMVRGRGYLRGKADLERLVLKAENGIPVLVRDVARVELVPDERRGIAELNGEGEAVSGIAIARYGQNALEVIRNVKARLGELTAGFPEGVSIRAVYDRSDLILRAIDNLRRTLLEESAVVAAVCALFLLHLRSALVAILMLPVGVLIAFAVMFGLGMNSNIMSLGGIAIAIGAMVDAAIVMIENAHKHLERSSFPLPQGEGRVRGNKKDFFLEKTSLPDSGEKRGKSHLNLPHPNPLPEGEGEESNGSPLSSTAWEQDSAFRHDILLAACREVGPALFFSLLIITVSFLPVFALEAQEGRLFQPLAYTKTFAMAGAAVLSLTLVPVLMLLFVRGRILPEARNPVNRLLMVMYRPVITFALRRKMLVLLLALGVLAATGYPASQLGGEFMPTLNEGTLLFMPQTLPGLSTTKAAELLQTQDRIIKSFPEVESVFGKAGRALTATDPAPLEMAETLINLKPESEWRVGMTTDKLVVELDEALRIPGVSNAWTMPIKNRIDMLATGIRTPIGIKLFGQDLNEMDRLAREIEQAVKAVPGTTSAYAERITGGYYLNIDPDYEALSRYGLTVGEIQDLIAQGIGGETITTMVEGRERFGILLRYPRELRDSPEALGSHVLVPVAKGASVPLGQLARIGVSQGPPGIRTENALLSAYIYVDMRGRDIAHYVEDAKRAVERAVRFPPGYYITWSGQFEYMERARERLQVVVPLTLGIIFVLLYLNFGRLTETLIVMASVPFALVGGIWLLWLLDYNASVAVGVGFIALAGVAAETGVVMLIYLDQAYTARRELCRAEGRAMTREDLQAALMEGAAERLRPKMMTVAAIMAGLLPIMWSEGTGSEVMSRIAAPMVGGMVSSTVLTLIVIPAVYALVKGYAIRRNRS
jgi:Cu(I)/Ag(I) efflux system membrane protein CusA/SilA